MRILIGVLGALFILYLVVLDAFETIVLPRRVTRRFRLTMFFYMFSVDAHGLSSRVVCIVINSANPSSASFGLLSLIALLSVWAFTLVLSFSMVQSAFSSTLNMPEEFVTVGMYLYMSGEILLFTLRGWVM